MIRTKILMIVFILFLISCRQEKQNKSDKIIHYLTNGSKKYWTFIKEYPIKRYSGDCYDINGTYTNYIIHDNGARVRSEYSSQTWKLLNDSMLLIGQDIKLHIEYINDDIIVFNNMVVKELYVETQASDQKTVPIADTSNHLMHM